MYFVQTLCTGPGKIILLTQFTLNSFKKWLLRRNSKIGESKVNSKNDRSTEHVHQTESVYRGICGEWHVDFTASVVPRTLSLKAALLVLAPYIIYRHGTHSQNAIRSAGRISTTLAYVSPFLSSSFLTTYALSLVPRLDLARKVQRGKCIPHGVSCHRSSRVLHPVLEKCHRRFDSWHCLLDPSIELRRFSFIPCSCRYQSWYSLYSAQ